MDFQVPFPQNAINVLPPARQTDGNLRFNQVPLNQGPILNQGPLNQQPLNRGPIFNQAPPNQRQSNQGPVNQGPFDEDCWDPNLCCNNNVCNRNNNACCNNRNNRCNNNCGVASPRPTRPQCHRRAPCYDWKEFKITNVPLPGTAIWDPCTGGFINKYNTFPCRYYVEPAHRHRRRHHRH